MSRPSASAATSTTVPLPPFHIHGELTRPLRLTVQDLHSWPAHSAHVSFECATDGTQHHRFEGPLLHDVLRAAEPAFDPARRKDRLRFLLAVTGADGHHVILSWGEIDPEFGHTPVLLATRIDDTPLDLCGPQLVLPQDRYGSRYISAITTIHVHAHPAGAPLQHSWDGADDRGTPAAGRS